jgi:membrane protease YdiL (CAAX protease family)
MVIGIGVFTGITVLNLLVDHDLTRAHIHLPDDVSRLILLDASLLLLMPLILITRHAACKQASGRFSSGSHWAVWGSILLLFSLAFCSRTVLTLQGTLLREKVPVSYLVILAILAEGYSLSAFGITRQRVVRHILLGVFLFLIFGIPTTLGVTWLMTGRNPFQSLDFIVLALSLPYQILGVALAEEGLFRGYIQTKLETLLPAWGAVILQAFFFGIWHIVHWLSPLRVEPMTFHFAASMLFGIVLGTYFHHTRSVTTTIVLHALFNSVLAAVGFDAWRLGFSSPLYLSLAGLGAIALTVLIVGVGRRVSQFFGAA